MSNAYLDLIARAISWSDGARAAGWQSDVEAAPFRTLEQATPNELFAQPLSRPLVVAFFGGTGVGKSSLLNRLAGAAIALTGVERPTSHEVTMFLHEAVCLADLPSALPVGRVRIQRHTNAALRRLLWIDTPDFDSIDRANRELALASLPHVDLVVYVVSPERYRDDIGWEILRERALKHGWIFVINRCDEGNPEQARDFHQSLRRAGFSQPVVLTTCCAPGIVNECDQFEQLASYINELVDAHEVSEFEQLGRRARLGAVHAALQEALRTLGETATWRDLQESFRQDWRRAQRTIAAGMVWPIATLAASLAARQGVWSPNVGKELRGWCARTRARAADLRHKGHQRSADDEGHPAIAPASLATTLWDEWAQSQLTQPLDQLEIRLGGAALPSKPLRTRLDAVLATAPATIADEMQKTLQEALARPGTRLQRGLRTVTRFALFALPLAALLWVAHTLVLGYHAGATGKGPYLGLEFAIHSGLLVLSAWLIPWLTHRLLCPSVEKTALRALRVALDTALGRLGAELSSAWQTSLHERAEVHTEGTQVAREIARRMTVRRAAACSPLTRLLASPGEERSQAEQIETRES
jgi:hypothetical protein